LRYWSNEAQAGDSSTTGSAAGDASASRAAAANALSRVPSISCGAAPPNVAANPPGAAQTTGPEAGYGRAWTGPPIADELSATACDFLADYLFNPDTGVVQRATRGSGAVLVGTFVTYHDPGIFIVSTSGGDQAAVRTAIDAALRTIGTPLDPVAFEAARRRFLYHILSDASSPSSLADTFGWYTVEGNPAYAPGENGAQGRYFQAVDALTPAFVAATVTKYLSRPGAVVTVTPSVAPPQKGSPT